jgi:hypothetical protein
MGNYLYKEPVSTRLILINQATCYQCNSTVKDQGVCKCGNVEVYGGTKELGRKVIDTNKYADCNLIEYRRK